jgi:hypothetical protein
MYTDNSPNAWKDAAALLILLGGGFIGVLAYKLSKKSTTTTATGAATTSECFQDPATGLLTFRGRNYIESSAASSNVASAVAGYANTYPKTQPDGSLLFQGFKWVKA